MSSKTIISLTPVGEPQFSPPRLPPNGKRFFIWTIGCQMNEADSAKVASMLQEVGYERTEQEDDADIVVLNSCVVRQAAEDKVSGKLNALIRLKRQKPEMPLVLTGCMVTNQQEKLREQFPHVDLFFDPSDFDKMQQVVPELALLDDDLAALPHYYQPETDAGSQRCHGLRADHLRLQLPVLLLHRSLSPGQGNQPPDARHRDRSRADRRNGVREVTLLGQTVNAWGHDLAGQAVPGGPPAASRRDPGTGPAPVPHLAPEVHD